MREPANNETALITGASSGIGLHLAREFAAHGHPVILTAPVEAELQQVASSIRNEFGVETRLFAKDLERPASAQEIFDALQLEGTHVDILVNNAGHGQHGNFWEYPLEKDISILRLNCEAVLRMTKLFLQPLVARGHGRILNVASIGSFMPGPGLAVYHATKAFILSWSEALATELEDTAVTVTALCPGPTDTDFFPKAEMEETRAFQKAQVMAPQEVAKIGYKAAIEGDRVVVAGVMNKAMVFSRRFMSEAAQAALQKKMLEEVAPEDHKRNRGDVEMAAESKSQGSA